MVSRVAGTQTITEADDSSSLPEPVDVSHNRFIGQGEQDSVSQRRFHPSSIPSGRSSLHPPRRPDVQLGFGRSVRPAQTCHEQDRRTGTETRLVDEKDWVVVEKE